MSQDSLKSIDPFIELAGKNNQKEDIEDLNDFLNAWSSLQYNLVTNDGEQYEAKEASSLIAYLAQFFSREVVESLTTSKE